MFCVLLLLQLRGIFYVAALAGGIIETLVGLERSVAEALGQKHQRRGRHRHRFRRGAASQQHLSSGSSVSWLIGTRPLDFTKCACWLRGRLCRCCRPPSEAS